MSISNARSFFEKTGCGLTVGVVFIVIMVFSLFNNSNCRGANSQDEQSQAASIKLASIGNSFVSVQDFSSLADRQIQSMGASVDPSSAGLMYANVAQSLVSRALVQAIAEEKGLAVSDDEIREENKKQVDSSLLQLKMSMIQGKVISSTATEAEFAAAYEKQSGKSLADVKKQIDDDLNAAIADPAKRADLAFSTLGKKLTDSYKSTIKLTDEDLKKGYDTYTTRRIIAYSNKQVNGTWTAVPKAEQDKLIADAQAALASGMSFEDAMNKFTDDPKAPSMKTKSESTIDLTYATLTYDKSLEPILKLKLGEVSSVLQTSSGPAIFKLYKIQPKIPSDFEKSKATIRDGRLGELANKTASEDLRKRLGSVKYDSPLLKILVDWRVGMTEPDITADKAKRKEFLKKTYEAVMGVNETILTEAMITTSQYAIFKDYFDVLSPEERKDLESQRTELLAKALVASPHVESYHELAKLALDQKDVDTAVTAIQGATDLTSGGTPESQANHKTQRLLIDRIIATNLAKPEQIKLLEDGYHRWETDLVEEVRLAAEGNSDHTDAGETEYKTQLENVAKYEKAGYIGAKVAGELRTALNQWKEGITADLKLVIEQNEDYSAEGQTEFSNQNARIERYFKAGYINQKDKDELMALQSKWKEKKKAFDAEQAKNAPKPSSNPEPKPKAPGSNDILNPKSGN